MYSNPNRARERIPIHKAEGVTQSEKYLSRLCERTFLSLWSYPGIFRNQKEKGKGDGKELCDMLVVFGEHILIFSDKHCSFPSSGNLKLDWQRWYKKAIKKSADQAWGAERWLKSFPKMVYLDRACTKPFPLDIPSQEFAKYHLIVVAHGSEDRCIAKYGGSGSLMLFSSLGDDGNMDELSSTPFVVGDLDKSKTFIHVLTESTLEILLLTLDTISDFVWYLDKKEKFLRNMVSVNVPGEEEILAYYLGHINGKSEHDFVFEGDFNGITLEEGFWEDFCKSPQRQEQIRQNEISYIWDNLIERFNVHILNATQYFTNHLEISDTEKGIRFMAREPRTRRRMIMKSIINVFTNTPDGTKHIKCLKAPSPGEPFYVFLCLPRRDYDTYEEYREVRGGLLEACLMVVKYKFPEALDIVGIASEPLRFGSRSSEDLLYLDAREWSDELEAEAAKLQKELKILTSPTISYAHENDYPEL
jgi:hypothetical protein